MIHEASHFLACVVLKVKAEKIRFMPYGVNLVTEDILNPVHAMIISASGPVVSGLIALFLSGCKRYYLHFFAISNLGVFALNVFPALPLDGGVFVKNMISYAKGYISAHRWSIELTRITAFVFCIFGIIFVILSKYNISLLVISSFLLYNLKEERKKLIRLYGATLIETEDFKEAFKKCDELMTSGYFCSKQFENKSNSDVHYNITASEIINKASNFNANCFVAGVGTSGTLIGVGSKLKNELGLKIIAIEPENARILTSPPPYGKHMLQGLSDEILPKLYNPEIIDNIIQIKDNDAIAMARKLCSKLSLGVGISSGANFLGAVLSETQAITILPDDNKKYLTTKLSENISSTLVDSIELLSLNIL
jgi:hypothetical protein